MLQECAWSLYMLKIRSVPQSPVIWIAVMSGHSIARAVQLLEEILVFTRIIDLVHIGLSKWLAGYTAIHFDEVRESFL